MTTSERHDNCTVWCVNHAPADPACWSDDTRTIALSMEPGYALDADPDSPDFWSADLPKMAAFSHRRAPGRRPVVRVWCYSPNDNDHLYLDANVDLTADEARKMAAHLIATADEIEGAGST